MMNGLLKNWISNPLLGNEEDGGDFTNKVGENKRPREKNYKSKLMKKIRQEEGEEGIREMNEMWNSITNGQNQNGNDNKVVEEKKKRPRKKKEKTELDDEIEKLFSSRKKMKENEPNHEAIGVAVEKVMATLEIAVEDDIELNKLGKPAINKLMKLPLLKETLLKKKLQVEFLDHGVLNLLKNWLEPLPDGSLPSINIREAILNILNDLPLSLDLECRREQMSKSGLGKVVMFLSKFEEETSSNKKLACELVSKWSRMIYNKSTRYEDLLSPEEREAQRRMLLKKQNKAASLLRKPKAQDYFQTDVFILEQPKSPLAPPSIAKGRARVPQKMSMDFTIRPESKIDEKLEARVKKHHQIDRHKKNIMDAIKEQKAQRKQRMQACKISVNGRT